MDEHGYDRGVCMGHGDFSTEPRRLTLELIARIQDDARAHEREREAAAERRRARDLNTNRYE